MSEDTVCGKGTQNIDRTSEKDPEERYAGLIDRFFREMRAPKTDFDQDGHYAGRHLEKVQELFPFFEEIVYTDIDGLHGIEICRLTDTEKVCLRKFFYHSIEKGLKFYGRVNKYFDGFTRIPDYVANLIGKRGENFIIVEKNVDSLLFKVGFLYSILIRDDHCDVLSKKMKLWVRKQKSYEGELLFRYSFMLLHGIAIIK